MSSMVEANHHDMVDILAKPGKDINEQMTDEEAHLIHMVMGICGEAGELLDAIKKFVIYKKPLDRENVVEELGDLEFYLEGLRQGLGVKREITLIHNLEKLAKRYKGYQYSNEAAQARADKND